MSNFFLKVTTKSGNHVITLKSEKSTIKDLKNELVSLTNIAENSLHIFIGYPRRTLDASNDNKTLADSGLKSGETLIIEERTERLRTSNSTELVQAISEQENCPGILLKRVVPADNSCLFSSVYFVINRTLDETGEAIRLYRSLVADTIAKNTETYSEPILGKPIDEYCSWIKEPNSWGGAIELSVLSSHYGIEIAVVDTMNGIITRFGEDQKYSFRVFLMFDGIHYDPLYMETYNGEEIKTMFEREDQDTLQHAEQLALEAKSSRQFTDVNKFTLKCTDCGVHLSGQVEAQEHAKQTGHVRFGEL